MSVQRKSNAPKRLAKILCAALLFSGAAGMLALASLREDLPKAEPGPPKLSVSVMEVQPVDMPFTLTGYGELKALNETVIAAEVNGRAVYLNPKLKPGEMIARDELLLQVDDHQYRIDQQKHDAVLNRIANQIQQLKVQHALDRERYAMARRNQDLARAQYERLKRLYYDHGAGSQSDLGEAEQALNRAKDSLAQLAQAIKVFPYHLRQAQCQWDEAQVQLEAAREDIKRCKIYAPFNGRVKTTAIETGQYVTAGQNIVTLADDSVLEVNIAIAGPDIRPWLQFEDEASAKKSNWFKSVKKVVCNVCWVEEDHGLGHKGRLHRAVRYDPKTRTLILAVRVAPRQTTGGAGETLPLVEGMFCRVDIPGRTMRGVYRLPRYAVSMQKQVYLSNDHHLKTVPVEIITTKGNEAIIGSGLNPGDRVIVTRLVHPIENTWLDIAVQPEGETK